MTGSYGTGPNTKRKVTMIIGEPCVGKSAIMRLFIKQPNRVTWVQGLKPFAHLTCERMRTTVLGKYDEGHQFPGTDRLSMSIQPVVQEWIDRDPLHHHVLFEGDRLGNLKMAQHLIDRGYDFRLVVIVSSSGVLSARRDAERHQPVPFVKGRATKVANIVAALPEPLVVTRINDTWDHAKDIADWLWRERT